MASKTFAQIDGTEVTLDTDDIEAVLDAGLSGDDESPAELRAQLDNVVLKSGRIYQVIHQEPPKPVSGVKN